MTEAKSVDVRDRIAKVESGTHRAVMELESRKSQIVIYTLLAFFNAFIYLIHLYAGFNIPLNVEKNSDIILHGDIFYILKSWNFNRVI